MAIGKKKSVLLLKPRSVNNLQQLEAPPIENTSQTENNKKFKKIGIFLTVSFAFIGIIETSGNGRLLLTNTSQKQEKLKFFSDPQKQISEDYKTKYQCTNVFTEKPHSIGSIDVRNNCRRLSTQEKMFDVMSIGYEDRLDYITTQQETWGSHRFVRSFWGLTEKDDTLGTCDKDLNDVSSHVQKCEAQHNVNNINMSGFRTKLYSLQHISRKKQPGKWICSQSRLVIGLDKVLKEYSSKGLQIPDYLVIVDDDTYVNIEKLEEYMTDKDSSNARVYSGCSENLAAQLGGFNLILSKGAIERLLRPLYCAAGLSGWEDKACKALMKSKLGEKKGFIRGNSLSEIAANHAKKHDFCLFAGWFLKYVVTDYAVSESLEGSHRRLLPYYEKENCSNNGDMRCHQGSRVCSWQTPEAMVSTSSAVLKSLL